MTLSKPLLNPDDLPDELIVHIITLAFYGTDHTSRKPHNRPVCAPYFPYTALFVNWRWHRLAFNTPVFWTRVCAWVDDEFDPELFRRRTLRHVELSQALASSMHLIVQVHQSYDQCRVECRTRRASDDVVLHHGPPFLSSLKIGKASWTSMSVISQDNICTEFIRGHILLESGQNDDSPISDLRSLDIEVVAGQCGVYRSSFESIVWCSETVPNLRRLRIKSLQFPWDLAVSNVRVVRSDSIRSMCLDRIHASAMYMIGKMECPSLETLFVRCIWNVEVEHDQRVREMIAAGTVALPSVHSAILINIPDCAVAWVLDGIRNVERLGISSLDRYLGRPVIRHLLENKPCPALSTLALLEDLDQDSAKELVALFADRRTHFLNEVWTVRGRGEELFREKVLSEQKDGSVRHRFFSAQELEPEELWKEFDIQICACISIFRDQQWLIASLLSCRILDRSC